MRPNDYLWIHRAGPLNEPEPLMQRCSRCGVVLTDYRNAMVSLQPGQTEAPPFRGWEVGSLVARSYEGGFSVSVSAMKADRDTSDEMPCGWDFKA